MLRAALRNFSSKATIRRKITKEDLAKFTELSGDDNPIHAVNGPERALVHGALLNSLVSRVIGTELPGPGSVVVAQTLNFPNKCYVDEEVEVTVEMVENRKIVTVKFRCEVPERGKVVLWGDAKLIIKKNK